ncbi:MAG: glutamine--fructose-6-phosphate transaminase (isomerizing) [Candidatus Methanosuratus sp.]|nr:glutamine--fructose-6-phosphate transaminase (isomerizing) [Candidatus Methanosuratincola sp.]
MCGIFGCICGGAVPVLIDGLRRLEYRGYDSVGFAVISGGRVLVVKDKGNIDEFLSKIDIDSVESEIGIGHTRWATHGAPCKENAHPHLDCTGSIAVVHNGVLENFLDLRSGLQARGHRFASNTDSEVIAHLIEEGVMSGMCLKDALAAASRKIRGSMAVAAISSAEPDRIVCFRRESPLVVGMGPGGVYCASDILAMVKYATEAYHVPEGSLATLTRVGLSFEGPGGDRIDPPSLKISLEPGAVERGGYKHFMLKEIHEQPIAVSNTLRIYREYIDRAALLLHGKRVLLTGSGTSYHACLCASYLMSSLGVDAMAVISSELQEYLKGQPLSGSAVVAVSQSGETADTLGAIRHAKRLGARVIGITNTLSSSITNISDAYLCTQGGPEIGVAATKSFLTQLVVLEMLSFRTALAAGSISKQECEEAYEEMGALPAKIGGIIQRLESVREIALKYSDRRDAFFLGRGINVATALEGALKLKEISYIHAEGYPAGESKHGPISLVEPGFLCVFVSPMDSTRQRIIGNIMEMKARGAEIFSVLTEGDSELIEVSDGYFEVPESPEYLYPVLCTVPLQALAYYVAIYKGLDPDRPRNLAKSVTVL